MRISLLQQNIKWSDIHANILEADKAINKTQESDLYILPEMWSTGFCMEPELIAEPVENSFALRWMHDKSIEIHAAIGGSIAIRDGDNYYNRFYFALPDGNIEYYDKRHLFSYSGENLKYIPGDKRVIVNYKGVRIMLQVCYDLRFPIFMRNHNEYDLLLCVANWPDSRREVWDILLRARAIENQSYVVGVNRTGKDPHVIYSGGSALIDAFGRVVAQCPDNMESSITVDIDLTALNHFRKKFPVLLDAD